jgi:hypothetical protein
MKSMKNSLDLIQIASPCTASWEAMKGDDRMRFCAECRLHVYNLSEMGQQEAEELVRQREGRMCVRFFRRQDGTVLTRDCPIGMKALRGRLARAVVTICGILFALMSGTLFGGAASRRLPPGVKVPGEAFADWIDPARRLHGLMGDVAPAMGGMCAPPPGAVRPFTTLDPAETPLSVPTAEQLEAIRVRLED